MFILLIAPFCDHTLLLGMLAFDYYIFI